ncbi:Oxo-4-hydroxy-4-carboxy-5-ureidoimidazoline decarboxylase [Biscogniauxia mediterranea]|nr:Oxo-4-hydroxy-4-carboxy-5-ureidoimidazoline decarboxylase [Biscogniauxia mediterranea]
MASSSSSSSPPSLPPISSLPSANAETIISALDTLFEPSPDIHALALPTIQQKQQQQQQVPGGPSTAPFTSYAALIQHVGAQLFQLAAAAPERNQAKATLHRILGSHPRLGAKKVDSAQSQAEQAQLNAASPGGADEAAQLRALNDEYEARFPGLRYVVFVNGRSRPAVMENMRYRIDRGDFAAEEKEAIQAMIDIALDRAKKLGG